MCAHSRGNSIVLVGFMGAGKTTVARELQRAGYDLVDLDDLIVRRCGRSIPEIFEQEGEEIFRQRETQALSSLGEIGRAVIATGGGIVGREENWPVLRRLGIVVYLKAEWETLRERLAKEGGRPLANPSDWARVEALWRGRLPLYERADLIVETQGRAPAEVAALILQNLEPGEAP